MPARVTSQSVVSPRPTTPELLSAGDLDKALHNKLLPAAHKLTRASSRIDTAWAENNIMSGVVGTLTGQLPKKATNAELTSLATRMLQAGLNATDGADAKPKGQVSVRTGPVDERALQALARTTAGDGFCYDTSNPENIKEVRKDIDALLRALDGGSTSRGGWGSGAQLSKDLQLVQASRQVKVGDNEVRTATVTLLINTRTNEFTGVYTRGGWDA